MGFSDWGGPVLVTYLAPGVTLVSRAYEESAGQPEPEPREAEGEASDAV